MITDYRLLSYNLPHNLEETINNYIQQGWQPFGSPFVDGDHYYQAIVQYSSDIKVAEAETTLYEDLLNA